MRKRIKNIWKSDGYNFENLAKKKISEEIQGTETICLKFL
jgi:hypothetical protein